MLRTPQSASRPPRPRRRVPGIDDATDNASGIFSTSGTISETTMASFLIESSGRTDGFDNSNHSMSPNTALLLRQKQEDAQVAIFSLNQFIFQAGNLYRGNRLNQNEQNILRISATRVGLSMDIVDGLLEHTSDSNAVVKYCMESNDSFARKIKTDRRLSMMLEQESSDQHMEDSFNLQNSIWRIFMHKIVQQVLRDHGMDINDVMNKSSLTSRLYEEALKNDEYLVNSAERVRIERDYSEERRHLSIPEDEVKNARRNAAAQMTFQHSRPFHDVLQRDDIPLTIEGGPLLDSRDDDMSLLTMNGSQREDVPLSSIIERRNVGRNVKTPPIYPSSKPPKSNKSRNISRPATDTLATSKPQSRSNPATSHSVAPEVLPMETKTKSSSPGAPMSAVKRALAMFENPQTAENDRRPIKTSSASKAGRGSSSIIAERLAVFERRPSQDNEVEEGIVLGPSSSAEVNSVLSTSLFDVFATPKSASIADQSPRKAASTSKISKVKRAQIAAFENRGFETTHDTKESPAQRVNKLNPEVRRLFDVTSNVSSFTASNCGTIPRNQDATHHRVIQKRFSRDDTIAKRHPVDIPLNSSGENGRLSAVEVSKLLQTYRENLKDESKPLDFGGSHSDRAPTHANRAASQQPFTNLNNVQRSPGDRQVFGYSKSGNDYLSASLKTSAFHSQAEQKVKARHIQDDPAFDSVSEMTDPAEDIYGLKNSWKDHSTPPTNRPRGRSSNSPTVRFNEMTTSNHLLESANSFNDENRSPSFYQLSSPSKAQRSRGSKENIMQESPVSNSKTEKQGLGNPQKSAMDKMLQYARTPPKSRTPRKQAIKSAQLRDHFLGSMSQPSDEERSHLSSRAAEKSSVALQKATGGATCNGIEFQDYGPPRIMKRQSQPKSRLSLDEKFDFDEIGGSATENTSEDQIRIGQNDHPRGYSEKQGFLHEMISTGASSDPIYIDDMIASLSRSDDFTPTENHSLDIEEQEKRPWVEFQQMFGSLNQARYEASSAESELSSSKEKFVNMFGTLNEVKNEAMDLERRKQEREASLTTQPRDHSRRSGQNVGNEEFSSSFFEGIKLSGHKAEFQIISAENENNDSNSDEPVASHYGGDLNRKNGREQNCIEPLADDTSDLYSENELFKRVQTKPKRLDGPQTDPEQWASFQNLYYHQDTFIREENRHNIEESQWPEPTVGIPTDADKAHATAIPIGNTSSSYHGEAKFSRIFNEGTNKEFHHQPKPDEYARTDALSQVSSFGNDGNVTTSTLTFSSAGSDFDAFNKYEPGDSTVMPFAPVQEKAMEKARIHLRNGPVTDQAQNNKKECMVYPRSPVHDKAIEKARVHLERDQQQDGGLSHLPQDQGLPAPPSKEDEGLPAAPSGFLDDNGGDNVHGQPQLAKSAFQHAQTPRTRPGKPQVREAGQEFGALELQKSSSSLSRLLRVDTGQSEEDDTWLNSIEQKTIHQNSQDTTNHWDNTDGRHPDSPTAFRSKSEDSKKALVESDEEDDLDEETKVRAAAQANGVPSHVIDIILQQAQQQEQELIRSEKEQDLTSWDAIADNDTLRRPHADTSPVADSTNLMAGFPPNGKQAPTNALDVSLIPDEIPVGVSHEDVKLLHRFIELSTSDNQGRQLSPDSEVRVRAAAIKVGLAEAVIDQMLEQARWKRAQLQQADEDHLYDESVPHVRFADDSDGGKYPCSPGATHQSSVHDDRRRHSRRSRERGGEPYCYDPCTILGNIKENLMYWANCHGGGSFDDEDSNVSGAHQF